MLPKMWLTRKTPVVTYSLQLSNWVWGSGWWVRVARKVKTPYTGRSHRPARTQVFVFSTGSPSK